VIGRIVVQDLLHARRHDLTEEHHRSGILTGVRPWIGTTASDGNA
jgi:hypothetical protein